MGGGPNGGGAAGGRRDEVVLITGCSDGGIGAALANEFCKAGFSVVATSRSLDTMKSFRGQPHVEMLALDVSVEESTKAAVDVVMNMYGRIDILVNNAGMPCTSPLVETPISLVEKVYRTNFLGPVMLIQAVVPHMIAKGKGKIVNVGSIGAYACGPWTGVYSGPKAALHAASDALRMELKPFNIDVILLVPGAVLSSIGKRSCEVVRSYLSSLQLFKQFEPFLLKRAMLSQGPNSTTATEFAEKAVRVLVRKSPPAYFTYGYFSSTYQFLYYCPYWVRDWWFSSSVPSEVVIKKES